MDTLSTLLENIHLYETKYYRLKTCGQWSYSITKKDVIFFYLVESGEFCIEVEGKSRLARQGDMIMLSNSYSHICHEPSASSKTPISLDKILTQSTEEPIVINASSAENAAIILIECKYDKEVTRPLLSALPTILPDSETQIQSRFVVMESGCNFLSLESSQQRIGKTAMINNLAGILMIECLRTYIEQLPEATDNWLMAIKDPYLAKALAVMHDAPNENWTIHKLAEVAGMSRSSFAERFKEIVGVPPLTYLIDYRLRLAARYLRLQQYSISRISELVGYASDSTFSQAFKRVYGVSPRAYRQEHQKVGSVK